MSNMTLGEIVRTRRQELGMSQPELAKLTGMSQSGISQIETGKNCPSIGTLDVIASHLLCSTSDLLRAREDGKEESR